MLKERLLLHDDAAQCLEPPATIVRHAASPRQCILPCTALQVVIETVDSFQGKQMDVVIMSCVRASEPGQQTGIGFVADIRRLNVAITRAKRALWILGSAATLKVLSQPAHYLHIALTTLSVFS